MSQDIFIGVEGNEKGHRVTLRVNDLRLTFATDQDGNVLEATDGKTSAQPPKPIKLEDCKISLGGPGDAPPDGSQAAPCQPGYCPVYVWWPYPHIWCVRC